MKYRDNEVTWKTSTRVEQENESKRTEENTSEKATGMGTNENVEGGNANMKQATGLGERMKDGLVIC